MDISLCLLFIVLSLLLIRRLAGEQSPLVKPFFWPALGYKLLMGLFFGWIYMYYYGGGDTLTFFHDVEQLNALFKSDAALYFRFLWEGDSSFEVYNRLNNTQERSLFLVKTASLIGRVAMGNYWMITLYLSLLSFLGAWYLFVKVVRFFSTHIYAAAGVFLFFPSVVFWSAGLSKESLAMAVLFFLAGLYLTVMQKEKPTYREWLLCLPAIVILWKLKYYWAGLFIPSAVAGILTYRVILPRMTRRNPAVEIALWCISYVLLSIGISVTHPNLYLSRFLEVLVANNQFYTQTPHLNADIHFFNLEPSWWSVFCNSPWALFSALFRPFPWEVSSWLRGFVALENVLIMSLTLYAAYHIKMLWNSTHRTLLCSILIYSVLLCIFLALSTPNLGALSRYRIGFLPFLLLLLCLPMKYFKRRDGIKL